MKPLRLHVTIGYFGNAVNAAWVELAFAQARALEISIVESQYVGLASKAKPEVFESLDACEGIDYLLS